MRISSFKEEEQVSKENKIPMFIIAITLLFTLLLKL